MCTIVMYFLLRKQLIFRVVTPELIAVKAEGS